MRTISKKHSITSIVRKRSAPSSMERLSPREKLPVCDDLSLGKIDIPKLPTDIMFPEELNKYLRDQIQTLTHENGMLKKAISEKEIYINNSKSKTDNLEMKIKQYEHFTSNANTALQGSHADLASSKIVELSKKLRETTADLEGYKTRCSKLENKIKQMVYEEENEEPPVVVEKKVESPDQIKQLSDKLAATSRKLFESKNQNMQLMNDLKQANKLLSQEIGESFTTIQNLSSSSSTWRGRAQQILSLQKKLAEYQDKLSMAPMERENNNTLAIRQLESNRRQVQEQLSRDLTTTKAQLEETKRKLDGARARIKVLENDMFGVKTRINALLEKSDHDDQLIKALTGQIGAIEDKHKEKLYEKRMMYEKLLQDYNANCAELEREKMKQDGLQKLILEREAKIEELKVQIKFDYSLKKQHKIPEPIKEPTYKFSTQEEKAVYRAAEAERLRLIDMVSALNDRIDSSRTQLEECQLNLKKEKQKASRLEVKISKLELEKTMSRTTLYSRQCKSNTCLSETKNELEYEDLKNRLELANEQVLLLQTRLETLSDEKKMDLENFNLMIESSRRLFHEELTKCSDG